MFQVFMLLKQSFWICSEQKLVETDAELSFLNYGKQDMLYMKRQSLPLLISVGVNILT